MCQFVVAIVFEHTSLFKGAWTHRMMGIYGAKSCKDDSVKSRDKEMGLLIFYAHRFTYFYVHKYYRFSFKA